MVTLQKCRIAIKGPGDRHKHRNSVGAFSELAVGSRVVFSDEIGEKGAQATTAKLLGKHGLRV